MEIRNDTLEFKINDIVVTGSGSERTFDVLNAEENGKIATEDMLGSYRDEDEFCSGHSITGDTDSCGINFRWSSGSITSAFVRNGDRKTLHFGTNSTLWLWTRYEIENPGYFADRVFLTADNTDQR
jgi:hypothetical protein